MANNTFRRNKAAERALMNAETVAAAAAEQAVVIAPEPAARAAPAAAPAAAAAPVAPVAKGASHWKILAAYGFALRDSLDPAPVIHAELEAMPASMRIFACRKAKGRDPSPSMHTAIDVALAMPFADGGIVTAVGPGAGRRIKPGQAKVIHYAGMDGGAGSNVLQLRFLDSNLGKLVTKGDLWNWSVDTTADGCVRIIVVPVTGVLVKRDDATLAAAFAAASSMLATG